MARYLVGRLGQALLVMLAITTIVFFVLRLAPGDPARILLGDLATQEEVHALRVQMGLEEPLHVQYTIFIRNLLQGNMGKSIAFRTPAFPLVLERLPATVELSLVAWVLAIVIAFPLGLVAAVRPRSPVAFFYTVFTAGAQAMPSFWLGIMLMLVFAAWLQILPGSGRGAPQQMILPALALALNPAAILARLIRAGMVDVMEKDYIRTALAKGLGEVIIIVRHALKNMLIPVVTLMGLQLGVFLGGAVVTETVFAWPGVGRLAIVAIGGRDYPMVQSAVLVLAFVFTLVNLLVDIAYMFLDPRIRYA